MARGYLVIHFLPQPLFLSLSSSSLLRCSSSHSLPFVLCPSCVSSAHHPPVLRSHTFFPILFPSNACYVNSLFHHSMSVWNPSCTPYCICSPFCKVHVPWNLPHFLPKAVSDIRLTGMLPAHNNFPFNLQQGGLTSPLLLLGEKQQGRKCLVCHQANFCQIIQAVAHY